jgi:pimeloyl-ACP methyl ester carboxylesterase
MRPKPLPRFLASLSLLPQLVLAQERSFQPVHVDSGRVSVSGSSLYYEAAGRGPTIILLHAGSLDRRMWDDQFQALARSYRVIRYDARGHGRSGPAIERLDRSRDLAALMQDLRISRAALVGSSLGGATAIDFALAYPDKVTRLILVSSGLSGYKWPAESRDAPWRVAARAAAAKSDTVGIARSWLQSDYFAAARESPALAARLDTLLAENVEVWKGSLQRGPQDSVFAGPALSRLNQLHAPTLIVVGDRDIRDIHRTLIPCALTCPKLAPQSSRESVIFLAWSARYSF